MTNLRKAAEMALEAFQDYGKQYPHMQKGYMIDAEQALRAALAEPEQEQITPLNDEQIARAWAGGDHNASAAVKRRITRAIEAELGVKK